MLHRRLPTLSARVCRFTIHQKEVGNSDSMQARTGAESRTHAHDSVCLSQPHDSFVSLR